MSMLNNADNNIFADIIQEKKLHGRLLENTQVIWSVVKKKRVAQNIFSLSLSFSANFLWYSAGFAHFAVRNNDTWMVFFILYFALLLHVLLLFSLLDLVCLVGQAVLESWCVCVPFPFFRLAFVQAFAFTCSCCWLGVLHC